MIDRRGMHHDTDISARNHCGLLVGRWHVDTVSPAWSLDMPFARYGDDAAYVRRL